MDYIFKGNVKKENVRFIAINAKNLIEEMRNIHNTTYTATAAAGRAMMGTLMLSYMMKNDTDVATVIISGDGDIGKITITAKNDAKGKCDILNPQIPQYINEKGKLDVKKAIGNGNLTVIKDLGLKQPYIGQTELISGEIAEDFAYYFTQSEQTPTAVALGVFVDGNTGKVKEAGGFMLQVMPNCSEEIISQMEKNLSKITSITTLLNSGQSLKDILMNIIFTGYELEFEEERKPKYYCDCSEDKIKKVILSLGKEELEKIIYEDKGINLCCHFCNKEYFLSTKEIIALLEDSKDD